ncbi:hypothetical protein, conserved in T. vivax [Trypanosoma vivax Y486]|uniref:Uncharacterized protein n=1 Tax=Trypanosoma vivax (strain Y486) TaxID=1055687 RepID=F9WSZ9_TRYVY|nr:hypothetical protein, conserved in T. vivax [Trypanosoma vivax Y486]|eukprot:CCD20688.1 hypothetical protein, conserved in T. vivax [Trypanosoma vivax Y486]
MLSVDACAGVLGDACERAC